MNPNPTTPPRNRRPAAWRKWIPWLIGASLLLLIVAGLRPKPIEVETARVTTGPLTVSVLEEGKTRIRHRYLISPPVAGFLNRVPLRAGEKIEAGKTVLATLRPQSSGFLDPRTRAEAEARLHGAEAAKKQRETEVGRARATLDLASKDRERARQMARAGVMAASEIDSAESKVEVLSRELHAAEFAFQIAEFERAQAEAALSQAQNPAAEDAKPLEIIAPVNGYVLNVLEENARVVTAGTAIMEVGDPTDLEAEIELLSSDAVAVQVGAEVSIEQWGGPKPLRGRVTVVEPGGFTKISALGVEEQRVKTRVEFVDPLPSGVELGDRYRVEARIVTWHGEKVLQVPAGVLFRRGEDWMAFRLEGGKAREVKVEIAHNNGAMAEVLSGLRENQIVILHPPEAVADGVAVRPRS